MTASSSSHKTDAMHLIVIKQRLIIKRLCDKQIHLVKNIMALKMLNERLRSERPHPVPLRESPPPRDTADSA